MVMITKKPRSKGLGSFLYSMDEKLHEPGFFNDTFDKLEQRTGLKRLQVAAGRVLASCVCGLWLGGQLMTPSLPRSAMLLVYFLLLLFGPWASALCNLSGFLHPAHAT
jgi:hypothetical protein